MNRILTSELLKLRRPTVLLGVGGVLPLLSVVATLTVLLSAGTQPPTDGPGTTLAELSRPGGLTTGFSATAVFLGLLVFGLFATSFGTEHTSGTLRAMLVREPRRLRLLSGKWLALAVFTAASLLVALVASALTALAIAPSRGIDTSVWSSTDGLVGGAADYRDVLLSALLYGTLGAVTATLLRSGVIALGVGLAWLAPIEHLIADSWTGASRWFPGLLAEAVGQGGTAGTPLSRALLLSALLAAATAALAATTFTRRDIST